MRETRQVSYHPPHGGDDGRRFWTVATYGAAFKSSLLIPCAVAPPPFAPAVVMRRYPTAPAMRDIAAVGVSVTRARAERAGHASDRAADNRARWAPRPPPAIPPIAAPTPAPTSPLPTSSCA